jgi:hypothetical protein
VAPDIVDYDYNKINKPQYDIILGVKTMKNMVSSWTLKTK